MAKRPWLKDAILPPNEDDPAIRDALARFRDPAGGGDIVRTGRVESVQRRDGLVQVTLRATRDERAAVEALARDVEAARRQQPGVRNVATGLTPHRAAGQAGAPPAHGRASTRPLLPPTHPANAAPAPPPGAPGRPAPREKLLPQVRHVVAVASGKGGVGKSTVAVNLALGLRQRGLAVGLLDADIHGPSTPRMLGLDGQRPELRGDRMQPLAAWGLAAMSIGFLVEEGRAMIWRGPMVMGALEQLMGQVDWPPLDVMIVDMPPGTGDAQLTMAQRVDLAGAVIVSTPQDIALIDARRGIGMFRDTKVPILGIVENMSVFCCPNCGHSTPIFGAGGARAEADKLGVPFLGAVPLLLDVREAGDRGRPLLAAAPASAAGQAFTAIAGRVASGLGLS